MKYGNWLGALILALISGCDSRPGMSVKDSGNGQSDPTFRAIEDDDAEMNAAIKSAQATLKFFENNWKTMPNDGYSLKFAMHFGRGSRAHLVRSHSH